MNLKESIEFLGNNKHLAAIVAKKTGDASFRECHLLIAEYGLLDNDTNRDEELDAHCLYYGKAHHLIRYVSGISEKGSLLATVLRDKPDKKAYIRDNGTMFGLCFGEYFTTKILNGHDWIEICDDIIYEYDVDDKDAVFINLIKAYFKTLDQSELDVARSLSDIVNSSTVISEMYYNTRISFVINLWKRKQHQKDMINCNIQPNPWIAYNHYMTVHKDTDAYRKQFLGKELLKWVQSKKGLASFTKGKLMYGYSSTAEQRKVNVLVPLIISYALTHFIQTADELNKAYEMIVKFEKFKDKDVAKYWTEIFGKVVEETTYKEIQDFYEKNYLIVFENDSWNNITKTILNIVEKNCKGTETTAMQGLHIKKYDTGLWFICMALWFKQKNKKLSYSKIIEKIVEQYIKLLNSNIHLADGSDIKLYDYFGNQASIYKSASSVDRMNKVFQYVTKEVSIWTKGRIKDRDIESELRQSVIRKLNVFVEEEGVLPVLYAYPLSNDQLTKFNIKTGDGLHWLHKNPHSKDGNAIDGFLGLTDDNLNGNVKYKNWNIDKPNDYWKMIIQRNQSEIDNLSDKEVIKKVKRTIATLEEMIEIDLSV